MPLFFNSKYLPCTVALFLLGSSAAGWAHEYALGALKIVHPWSRATPRGATTGVAYMKFINGGLVAVHLTDATTPVAQRVEIHVMSMDGGVMRMRPSQGLDIPAGANVELNSGGVHLMLIGLNRPLKQGDKFPMTLMFAGGETAAIEINVEAMGAAASTHDH